MGNGDLHSVAGKGANIVALCDPHHGRDQIMNAIVRNAAGGSAILQVNRAFVGHSNESTG